MKTRNIFLIGTLAILLTACTNEVQLPDPVAYKKVEHNIVSADKFDYSKYMQIQSETQNNDHETKLINKAFLFLTATLGKPLIKEKVIVKITKKNIPYPKMTYKNNSNKRIIYFSNFYMHESEMPIIVHELFHALYQTNAIIKKYPDFILEGMAVYVEYLYKYGTHKKAKSKLQQKLINSRSCKKYNSMFAFDAKFYTHPSSTKYDMYIMSGNLFANQKVKPIELIKQALHSDDQKHTVQSFINFYSLDYFPCSFKKLEKNIETPTTDAKSAISESYDEVFQK